jgi:hypothetical protein
LDDSVSWLLSDAVFVYLIVLFFCVGFDTTSVCH